MLATFRYLRYAMGPLGDSKMLILNYMPAGRTLKLFKLHFKGLQPLQNRLP
jgi:hypothetical protein